MEENNLLFEKLLDKSLSIVEKDKSIKKEREKRGDFFNIFSVLSLETSEVYHSKMIACLLNPKGLHGCGDLFCANQSTIVRDIFDDIKTF